MSQTKYGGQKNGQKNGQKKSKSKRHLGKNKKTRRKKGGCGCDKTEPTGLAIRGGNNPYFSFPSPDKMIPQNSYQNDMTDPANVIGSRQLAKIGGKRNKSKRQKGGASDFTQSLSKLWDFSLGRPTDVISSFGSTAGAVSSSRLASANSDATKSYSTTDQPSGRLFSATNPPKV